MASKKKPAKLKTVKGPDTPPPPVALVFTLSVTNSGNYVSKLEFCEGLDNKGAYVGALIASLLDVADKLRRENYQPTGK